MRSLIYIDYRIKSFWHCRLIKFEPLGCQGDCWPFCISGVGLQGQSGSSVLRPGTYLTQDLWAHSWNLRNIYFIYIGILTTQSDHDFAHVTTAQLSWHVQNCDLSWSLFFKLERSVILQNLKHGLINSLWNEPQVQDESSHFILSGGSGVGVTKAISSVPLFCEFFSIFKTNVSYWISRLYLASVAAAQLRWHLSNMNVIRRI